MELLETEKEIALIKQSLNIEDMQASYWYRTDKPYRDAMLNIIRAVDILLCYDTIGYEARHEVEQQLTLVE